MTHNSKTAAHQQLNSYCTYSPLTNLASISVNKKKRRENRDRPTNAVSQDSIIKKYLWTNQFFKKRKKIDYLNLHIIVELKISKKNI